MLPSVCIKVRLSQPRTAFVSRFLSVVLIFIIIFYCGRLVFLQLTSSIFSVYNIREASQEMKLGGGEDKQQNLNMRTPFLGPHFTLPEEFPYKYLINEPHLCHGPVFIINMILSALYNSESRQRIRSTWGNRTATASTGMVTVFVLGVSNTNKWQQLIEEESQTYHDIIQVNFIDSYRNLTLKTLTILHWTKTYCPSASWLLKSDDDVFVNPFPLKDILTNHTQAGFACSVKNYVRVCREEVNCPKKWAVSLKEYYHKSYPPYCLGAAYAISSNMVKKIFADANKTHPLPIEDVYFTGILPSRHMVQYINLRGRFSHKSSISENLWNGTIIFSLMQKKVRNELHYLLWDKIMNYNEAILSH